MQSIVDKFSNSYKTTIEIDGFVGIGYSLNENESKAKAIGKILNYMAKRKRMQMGVDKDLRGRKKQNYSKI